MSKPPTLIPGGYEERHYDVMLIAFHALCVSESRKKPHEIAADARAHADAFCAELVAIDQDQERADYARRTHDPDRDITHENAERDTEPPAADLGGTSSPLDRYPGEKDEAYRARLVRPPVPGDGKALDKPGANE